MQALCELNYTQFLRVLPDCDSEDLCYRFALKRGLHYVISILETAPYTTTVTIEQCAPGTPAYLKPSMTVRLYHDARMAEVLSSQNTSAIEASYSYPNQRMRQRNEKYLVNLFLAEWLAFCLKQQPRAMTQA
ncbi:DUF1249 domain-containing protein [Alteromonas sp. CYL-A6]|uniref:DUF1249 domain-containing protein n=1 Tax=Alteromonas nitratireducens TaxID=3390813 RepID=UPI0034B41E33